MTSIQQFIEIRRDGKIIDETMKVEDIFALGATEKVVEIQWRNGSQAVFFRDAYGVSAKVILGGDFIVANAHDNSGQRRVLLIINADGTQRFQLLNTQLICGKSELGDFRWFDSPRIEAPDVFGVIFNRARDNSMFQLDIDAKTAKVLAAYPIK